MKRWLDQAMPERFSEAIMGNYEIPPAYLVRHVPPEPFLMLTHYHIKILWDNDPTAFYIRNDDVFYDCCQLYDITKWKWLDADDFREIIETAPWVYHREAKRNRRKIKRSAKRGKIHERGR